MRTSGLVVEAASDRITIPATVMLEAGFKPSIAVTAFITDKRSRFLLVCQSSNYKAFAAEHKSVGKVEIKSLSTGSVSLRATTLAMAKIWPDSAKSRRYAVKQRCRNLIEVKLA